MVSKYGIMAGKRVENCILPVLPFKIIPVWKVCLHLTLHICIIKLILWLARKKIKGIRRRNYFPDLARNTIQIRSSVYARTVCGIRYMLYGILIYGIRMIPSLPPARRQEGRRIYNESKHLLILWYGVAASSLVPRFSFFFVFLNLFRPVFFRILIVGVIFLF